ncbi:beta-aspartyl-peptidase [Clostridium rectalis]|uniref:beta-aspartyl-peptidase n=1 Tax=Clostridium rectalis TaxID=2040295 RepID=UPI000F630DE5|nr:beta-aspartyl-peptidase [Clostridium rectalis]
MLTLIKGGQVYSPEYIGKKDILICGDKIERIDDLINIHTNSLSIKTINADDCLIFPGFIDSHVHIIGGGGEGGFKTRTPEIQLSNLTLSGITTVIGCLGTDSLSRNIKSLFAKSKALEEEGISSYMYTGSYKIPVVPLLNNIEEDIMLIDKIIGVGEVALSDHRSSQPSFKEFKNLVAQARIAGMLASKAGIVNIHIGDSKTGINYLQKLYEETDIPITQVIPTHVNRSKNLFKECIKYCKNGGYIDLTTSTTKKFLQEGEIKCSSGLKMALLNNVPIENISFSSDAQGSLPYFDDDGKFLGLKIGKCSSLYKEVRDAILYENINIEDAIKVITCNPAKHLKLNYKGFLNEGYDADIVMVNKKDLLIKNVIAKGKLMVKNYEALAKGLFED